MRRLFVLLAVALVIVVDGKSLGVAQDQNTVDEEVGDMCLASPIASLDTSLAAASPDISSFASPGASPEAVADCATPEAGTPTS